LCFVHGEGEGEAEATAMAAADKLRGVLEPAVAGLGYELLLVEAIGGAGGRILRVTIDAEHGIALGDCEAVSRRLSAVLDTAEAEAEAAAVLGRAYTLEVSSPGVERPLVKREHFDRHAGRLVRIRTGGYHLGRRRFVGRLLALAAGAEVAGEAEVVEVEVDGEVYRLPLEDIQTARLVVEWPANARAAPGSRRRKQTAR